ncbi:MAG: MBOAT family protein [Hungatella sp.]
MVFSSLLFLFRFLPLILIAYFAAPKRFRNGVLFIGSLLFYGWGEPVYIGLLLFSTLVDFIHGKAIGRFLQQGRGKAAKWVVASSAMINLSLLGFFKYTDFLMGAVNRIFGTELPLLHLALPIGISFYTFQTMSYTIDVYRGKAKVQNNIINFGAYVAMFPQLIAGPIVRYSSIAEELDERQETVSQFAEGIRCFLIGLGKKVLLANAMGGLWNQIQGIPTSDRTVVMMWLGILSYGMQIYFDFSGYSDMAVGLGHMFGFHFPENFRYPYTSRSITEFWNRWHISLSTWFKEYVYIPLGGNRCGVTRQVCNILLVWLLTGIWHGAGWNFLLWGVYFGVLLLLEKFVLKRYLEKLPAWGQRVYAMVLVFLGWVLFAHDDLAGGLTYYKQMFGLGQLTLFSTRTGYLLLSYLPLLAMSVIGSTGGPKCMAEKLLHRGKSGEEVSTASVIARMFGMTLLLLLVVAYLVDAGYNPFLYFRF